MLFRILFAFKIIFFSLIFLCDKKTKKIADLLTRYGIDTWTTSVASFGSDPGALTKEQLQVCIKNKKRWNSLAGIGDLL